MCRDLKLVIEVDGFSHDVQPHRDVGRDRWFRRDGYRVLHFTNDEVIRDTEAVVIAISAEVARLVRSGLAHP